MEGAVCLKDRPSTSAGRVTFVIAFPRELHGRGVVEDGFAAIHPSSYGNEAECAGVVGTEFDERWSDEVERVPIPEVHLIDVPFAQEAGTTPIACHESARRVRSRNQFANETWSMVCAAIA